MEHRGRLGRVAGKRPSTESSVCAHCGGRGEYFFPLGALLLSLGAGALFWLCYLGVQDIWKQRNSYDLFRSLFSGILGVFLVSLLLHRSAWFVTCHKCGSIEATKHRFPGAGARIEEDQPCPTCSYNLRFLVIGERCPECGAVVVHRDEGQESQFSFFKIALWSLLPLIAAVVGFLIAGGAGASCGIGLIASLSSIARGFERITKHQAVFNADGDSRPRPTRAKCALSVFLGVTLVLMGLGGLIVISILAWRYFRP